MILFTAYEITDKEQERLKTIFPKVHINPYYHHCTIQFGKDSKEQAETAVELSIIGQLTTDKVDCLLVDPRQYIGVNKVPHITLSTANGIKPNQSNIDLIEQANKIVYFDTPIKVKTRITTYYKTSNFNPA